MTDINRITLTCRVGSDPEYKYFENGSSMTTLSIAVNRYDTKTKEDKTDWYKIKTFSKLGEHIKKGYKLAIDGKLQTDSWETESGEQRKSVYIFAENLQILTPKEG